MKKTYVLMQLIGALISTYLQNVYLELYIEFKTTNECF